MTFGLVALAAVGCSAEEAGQAESASAVDVTARKVAQSRSLSEMVNYLAAYSGWTKPFEPQVLARERYVVFSRLESRIPKTAGTVPDVLK